MADELPDAPWTGGGNSLSDAPWVANTAPAATGPMSWGDVGSQAISNIPKSAGQFASDIAQPFLHPIDTATSLGRIGIGALQKSGLVEGNEYQGHANAVGKFFSDRYGGMENFKRTLANDPVGFAGDLSAVLTGGETALARAPGVIGKAGEIAGTVGRAVDPVTNALRVAKPTLSGMPRTLADVNVLMTPGQMAGPSSKLKAVEDAATSVPILGDFINSGRAKSIESFNKAVHNQALEPIGETLNRGTAIGHDAVDEVATKLGAAYDNLVPHINFVPDATYARDINRIINRDVAVLPRQYQDQFHDIMDSRLGTPARQAVPLPGTRFKTIESELTYLANQYRSSADAGQRNLGQAVDNVVNSMRRNLERANPNFANELAQINSGWAMYSRIRNAAARRTGSLGVFTPTDLLAAIKAGDKSVGKGSFAKGDALMQDFAEAGQKVLPSSIPDSGTARRLATMGAAGAGAFLTHNPGLAAAGAAATLPYTKPGMWVLNKYMDPTTALHQAVRGAGPPLGRTAFQLGRETTADQPRAQGGRITPAWHQKVMERK